MHDIDRTQLEAEWDGGEFGYEAEWDGGEYEYETGYDGGEFGYEAEWDGGEYGYQGEYYGEFDPEGPFSEAEEMELAAELLSVNNEAELDQFLGSLFKRIGRGARRLFRSPVFRSLGRSLKGIARKALPVVGGALGSMVAPGVGTAVGSALASSAGRMFGLELEGLSPEDQEFEVARRFVRLAGEAAKAAAAAPPGAPPQQVANRAIASAAQRHAPGLVGGRMSRRRPGLAGRWIRRGRHIILLGV